MGEVASCTVRVEGSAGGELAVTVRGPRGEVPVRLTGDGNQLVASFTPKNVGPHTLTAQYNNQPVPVSYVIQSQTSATLMRRLASRAILVSP